MTEDELEICFETLTDSDNREGRKDAVAKVKAHIEYLDNSASRLLQRATLSRSCGKRESRFKNPRKILGRN